MIIGQNKTMWGGNGATFRQCYKSAVKMQNDGNTSYRLHKDMASCYISYGTTPQEYFAFGYKDAPASRRCQFLTNRHKDEAVLRIVGNANCKEYLGDKYKFYKILQPYFHRDVCKIQSESDEDDFCNFISRHSQFIAKPLNGQCGNGVEIITISDTPRKHFEELLRKGPYIIEELIRQSQPMSQWNPSSVNTVRLPTFLNKSGFHVLKPFFRMGRKGSVVDNGAKGGVFAIIDEQTGRLVSDGYNENGDRYEKHPDSGFPIKGFTLPDWQSLMTIAEACARKMPEPVARYIGWDFAHTDNGWVLIEGNWGQFLSEFVDKEGIRNKFDQYMSEE